MCTPLRKIIYFIHSWQKNSENRGKPFASHGDEATVLTNTPTKAAGEACATEPATLQYVTQTAPSHPYSVTEVL